MLAVALPAHGAEPATTNTLQRAVSVSRQFTALAPGRLLPHAVCVFAEQVRREWAQLIEVGPAWRDPISIVVKADGSLVAVRAARTDFGLKYQILYGTTPLDQQSLAGALVEALCAEYANRAQPLARGAPFTVAPSPPWLGHGLAQSVLGRDESLVQAARLSLAGGHPPTATGLITTTELPADPAEHRLFRANAWLFSEGLLRLPHGAQKMRRHLVELGRRQSLTNAFWAAYREDFPNAGALERWWAVELSDRLTTVVARNLTVPETSTRLDEILVTRVTAGAAPTVVEFRDLWRFDEQPWMEHVLRTKRMGLSDLLARSGPTYRPVIERYLRAVQLITAEKTSQFRRVVAQCDADRARVEQEARQITTYLDHAERVFAPQELSATYSNFFRVFEEFEALEQHRRSPISDYLDRFDR